MIFRFFFLFDFLFVSPQYYVVHMQYYVVHMQIGKEPLSTLSVCIWIYGLLSLLRLAASSSRPSHSECVLFSFLQK